jgi:hypothetical protein
MPHKRGARHPECGHLFTVVDVRRMTSAVTALLLTATVVGCGDDEEKPVDPAGALGSLVRVHDALTDAVGLGETGVSRLSVSLRECPKGPGRIATVTWAAPMSDPNGPFRTPGEGASPSVSGSPAPYPSPSELATNLPGYPQVSHRTKQAMTDAMNALERGDHGGDDVRVLGVRAMFADSPSNEHALNSATWVTVASVYTRLQTPCLRAADGSTAPVGAVDPEFTLDRFRHDRQIPAEGWSRDNSLGTGPATPQEAIQALDLRLETAETALEYGMVPFLSEKLDLVKPYHDAGAARELDQKAVVRTVDRVGCAGLGMLRVVASVPLLTSYRFGSSSDPKVVDAWRGVAQAPWTGTYTDRRLAPFPGQLQPTVPAPGGPPVLLGRVDANGGVLLRGTPAETIVQAVSPCAKLTTDKVLAAALRLS